MGAKGPASKMEMFRWTIYIGAPIFAMWISNIPETADFFNRYWKRTTVMPVHHERQNLPTDRDEIIARVEEMKKRRDAAP